MAVSPDSTGRIPYESYSLGKRLDDNVALMKEFFGEDDTFRMRRVGNRHDPAFRGCVMFFDGMVNARIINEDIIDPLINSELKGNISLIGRISESIISGNDVQRTGDVKKLAEAIMYGDSLVFADGCDEALIVNSKGFTVRSISEPDDDKSLLGPREGFTESLMINLSMLHRKLQTPDLKLKFRTFGTRTNTKACICYLGSLVRPEILETLEKRLDEIHADGTLEANYIQERIKDSPGSIFKTTGQSEKPDIIASKILEGRIAILLDGTPMALTVPYLFVENFQAPDDYYLNFYYGSFGRLLRLLGLLITTGVPAIYVALLGFHQEMIPTTLMFSLTASTKGTPFPTIVEVLGMLAVFEILRETGLRMSNKIGSALSIVGALVLGQAAVEAKFVSAPTVIIVAMTTITGMMLPRMKLSVLVIRALFLIAAATIGIYGYYLSMLALLFYLLGMKSFGIEYTSQLFSPGGGRMRDIYLRHPFRSMTRRPLHMARDEIREGGAGPETGASGNGQGV